MLTAPTPHASNLAKGDNTKYQSARSVAIAFYVAKGPHYRGRSTLPAAKEGSRTAGGGRSYKRSAARILSSYETFKETGALPQTKATAKGRSLIYDSEIVKLCRSAIRELPKRWTAAMPRRKVSMRLSERGNLPGPGKRKGRQPP